MISQEEAKEETSQPEKLDIHDIEPSIKNSKKSGETWKEGGKKGDDNSDSSSVVDNQPKNSDNIEETELDRQQLLQRVKYSKKNLRILKIKNDYYRRLYISSMSSSVKADEIFKKSDSPSAAEKSSYKELLKNFVGLKREFFEKSQSQNETLTELEASFLNLEQNFNERFDKLQAEQVPKEGKKRKQTTLNKQSCAKEIEKFANQQRWRFREVTKSRLDLIRTNFYLDKIRDKLKQFVGLNSLFMDYEQYVKKKSMLHERLDEQKKSLENYRENNLKMASLIRHVSEVTDSFKYELDKETANLKKLTEDCARNNTRSKNLFKKQTSLVKKIVKAQDDAVLIQNFSLLKKMESEMKNGFDVGEEEKVEKQ